jgi:hypothetical protein
MRGQALGLELFDQCILAFVALQERIFRVFLESHGNAVSFGGGHRPPQ